MKAKTKHNTEPTQTETLILNFTTLSGIHPLDNGKLEITMNDLEAKREVKLMMNDGCMISLGLRLLQVLN